MNGFDLRSEVIHPLTVHFPIVLLLLASLLSWLMFFKRNELLWISMGWTLLGGVLSAWLAIYTGDLADGLVSRKLCDPTVLKQHENMTLLLSYLYSATLLFYGYLHFRRKGGYPSAALLVMALLGSGGALLLIYAGHLGASLVYEQAAGVQVPPADCSGF